MVDRRTTKKIVPGDRAFLLRQGVLGRGIFASGTFTSSVFQAEHWDGSGAIANYADVSWDTVIDPDDPLPIEALLQRLPQAQWEPQASGTQVNPAVVPELERLWSAHIASVRSSQAPTPTAGSVGEGQGRRLDTILRKQIEPPRHVRRLWCAPGFAESRFVGSHATVMMRFLSNSIGVSHPSWL